MNRLSTGQHELQGRIERRLPLHDNAGVAGSGGTNQREMTMTSRSSGEIRHINIHGKRGEGSMGANMGTDMVRKGMGLVLAFALCAFVGQGWLDPSASSAAPTQNGRTYIGNTASTTPMQDSYTAATNTFSAQLATLAGAAPTFMVNRSIGGGKNIVGYVNSTTLYIGRWDGAAWTNEWNIAVGGDGVNGQRFDIATEMLTGRAMVVYSTNANGSAGNEMAYRIYNGTGWTGVYNINSARLTQVAAVGNIKMVSRLSSNDIAMVAQDTGTTTANTSTITSFIWNGTAWGYEPATAHDTAMTSSGATQLIQYNQNIDLAYESLSGDMLVVWSRQAAAYNGYREFSNASKTWGTVTVMGGTARQAPATVAASNPYGNEIVVAYARTISATLYGHRWDGSAMGTQTAIGANGRNGTIANNRWINAAWARGGANDYGLVYWNTSLVNAIGYNYVTTAGAWGTASTRATGATGVYEHWLDADMDPYGTDTVMFTFSDSAPDLRALRFVVASGPVFTITSPTGSPMTATLFTNTTQNFDFEYDLDTTPPVESGGTLAVTPDYNTTHTSGISFTITENFTEDRTVVWGCEYTINGGTNWYSATVTGSASPYTCTASGLTAADGTALTIRMRAMSLGGTSTVSASLSRTADAVAPVDGALVATAGDRQVSLTMVGFSDARSGLRTSNTYKVVRADGASAPGNCNTGTQVYLGASTSKIDNYLISNGQQYAYRLCAYDNVDLLSAGVTNTATPQADKFGSSTCHACHTSTYTDAPTDSTVARNNPAGSVVGSHDEHVFSVGLACNECHTDNGSNMAHRTGVINMTATINSTAGSSYSRGTSFSQTNSPTPGTCNNTYCHSSGTSVATGTIPASSPTWGGSATTCTSCHQKPPAYANTVPFSQPNKSNSHLVHTSQYNCSVCHNNTTNNGGSTVTGPANHTNRSYNVIANATQFASYAFNANGGTCNNICCHGYQNDTWGRELGCVDCHDVAVCSPNATKLDASVTSRRSITPEFALTWSHNRSDGVANLVTNNDCGPCHMEAVTSTGNTDTTYHANGTIELRDPDTGLTIKEVFWNGPNPGGYTSTANSASFVRFSRNLASNSIEPAARATMINQCLHCHDSNGASNASAVMSGGTALKPFAQGIQGHTGITNSSPARGFGNVVDIDYSFKTSNASYHPVKGRANNAFSNSTTMLAPWNGIAKLSNTTTLWGDLITCWDCHAKAGASGTITNTVTAHGGSVTLRSPVYGGAAATSATNLCLVCHRTTYATTDGGHGAGSAFVLADTAMTAATYIANCAYCHAYTAVPGGTEVTNMTTRPLRAENVHGFNDRHPYVPGSTWGSHRPYAFVRNTLYYWAPANAPETPTRKRGCQGTGGTCNNNMSATTVYTIGGVF